jgi:hypothetical protein
MYSAGLCLPCFTDPDQLVECPGSKLLDVIIAAQDFEVSQVVLTLRPKLSEIDSVLKQQIN